MDPSIHDAAFVRFTSIHAAPLQVAHSHPPFSHTKTAFSTAEEKLAAARSTVMDEAHALVQLSAAISMMTPARSRGNTVLQMCCAPPPEDIAEIPAQMQAQTQLLATNQCSLVQSQTQPTETRLRLLSTNSHLRALQLPSQGQSTRQHYSQTQPQIHPTQPPLHLPPSQSNRHPSQLPSHLPPSLSHLSPSQPPCLRLRPSHALSSRPTHDLFPALRPPTAPTTPPSLLSELTPEQTLTSPGARHACPMCGTRFTSSSNLAKHLRSVHSAVRPHECAECGRGFAQATAMRKHVEVVHMRVKRHECAGCGARFGQSGDLNVHIRTVHEGSRPFECRECGARFGVRSHLVKHVKVVHRGIRRHECVVCKARFGEAHDLRKHLRGVHKIGEQAGNTVAKSR